MSLPQASMTDRNKAAFLEQRQTCQQEFDDYMSIPEESRDQEKVDLLTATLKSAKECYINYNRVKSTDAWIEV